jgi:hypothetical protein
LFKVQSVKGLFSTLGVDIRLFLDLLGALGLKETDVIINPEQCPKLRQLFETPAFREAVNRAAESQAGLLKNYLDHKGVTADASLGIVDIGWRGTIQDNIALLVPGAHFHGFYLGLLRFVNPQRENSSKAAWAADQNISDDSGALFTNFAAMELICSSRGGSVIGYTSEAGRTIPLRNQDQKEEAAYLDVVEPFQRGVLLAARKWTYCINRYALSSNELHKVALRAWDTLRRTPDEFLVKLFFDTPQQDFFGYGEIFHRGRYPSLSTIFLSPFLPAKRTQLIEFIRRVQWTEAIANAKDIGMLHRSLLLLAFRAAHIVKRAVFSIRNAR